MEENDLLRSFLSIRPGDVTLYSKIDPLAQNLYFKFPIVAIDVITIGNLPKDTPPPDSLEMAKVNRLKHHLNHECKKYDRPNQKMRKLWQVGSQ